MYVCMYVSVYICMYVCMYVCMCVCIYLPINLFTCELSHTLTCSRLLHTQATWEEKEWPGYETSLPLVAFFGFRVSRTRSEDPAD